MTSTPCNLIVVLGPTASGKTALGVALAERLTGEIIWLDGASDQVEVAMQNIESVGVSIL